MLGPGPGVPTSDAGAVAPAVVRRTVGWRSFRKRFLMNRKSSLYPGVDGTGVEGRGVSEPLAAGTPRSVPLGLCSD